MQIVIHTQADFTPAGKRSARVVRTDRGGRSLRWYVSGRIFRRMAVNAASISLTRDWIAAQ